MTTASWAIGSSGLVQSSRDRVGEFAHANAAFGQVVDEVDGVAHGAAEPVQSVHDDHVAVPGVVEQRNVALAGRAVAPDFLSK
jgi:hypothetical protein